MILYHTTNMINKNETILSPSYSQKLTSAQETLQDKEGVYFFTNIESAKEFGDDQNEDYVIFSVDCDEEHIIDPEYDGEAVFIETDEEIEVDEIVFEREL